MCNTIRINYCCDSDGMFTATHILFIIFHTGSISGSNPFHTKAVQCKLCPRNFDHISKQKYPCTFVFLKTQSS